MKQSKRILKVTIKHMPDDSPDTSYYGEYGSKAESEYAIDRKHSEDCQSVIPDIAEYVYILARAEEYLDGQYSRDTDIQIAMRESLGIEDARMILLQTRESLTECDCSHSYDSREYRFFNPNHENYKGLPEDEIRKYCRQDYDRVESLNAGNWCYLGIEAEAIVMLADGIRQEISSGGLWGVESDGGREYLQEIEQEQLSELKAQLRAIGFSARAIAAAFKDIKTEEN